MNYSKLLKFRLRIKDRIINIKNKISDSEFQNDHKKEFFRKNLRRVRVENNYNNLVASNSDLDDLLKRDDLKEMVKNDFLNGDYESSITKAFAYLEESIIYSGQKPSGKQEINYIPDDKTNEELRAVKFKLKGAINWFREPGANGYSPLGRAEAAAHILAYVDLQLTMMEKLNN